jgi:uncharacterized MAPEG superfamily protein
VGRNAPPHFGMRRLGRLPTVHAVLPLSPALLCLPAAFVLVYAPKLLTAAAMARQPEGYDNRDPREQHARLPPTGKRAQAAHLNGFEDFAPFAAAVLTATLCGAPAGLTNALAIVHVVVRVVYPVLYIRGIDRMRSAVWAVGWLTTLGLFLAPLAPAALS